MCSNAYRPAPLGGRRFWSRLEAPLSEPVPLVPVTSLSLQPLTLSESGASCLLISAHYRHLDMVKALFEAGGRKLLMLTADSGPAAS
jgi:hypothetical protein